MDEIQRVRDLAKETVEFSTSQEMERRRKLWTDHNSLHFTRPPIYIRSIPFWEYPQSREAVCTDPYLRGLEQTLLLNRYRMDLADDTVLEPFLTVRAAVEVHPEGVYGLPAELTEAVGDIRCTSYSPSIVEEEDIQKLCVKPYRVDEAETQRRIDRMVDVLGDSIPVAVDRQAELCCMWKNDISSALAKLRGLEQIMWDAYDRPEWLHSLVGYMRDQILRHIDETEAAGGFRLVNHQNQAMPYCRELAAPAPVDAPVSAKELWGYAAAQEFTTFGPDMFEEFMFRYQKPILERYGLAAYGCCEDLTRKIPIIKKLKNLRRIAVSPFADPRACAQQIGGDYVISWRPNPSSACSRGVDEDFVRGNLREVMDIFDEYGCKWDVTLKDLETSGGDPMAIVKWTAIVREELERHYG